MAHNRTNSATSTLTVSSDDFVERVRDNMGLDVDTSVLVRKAHADLRDLEQAPARFHNHPSTVISAERLDPHGVLQAMLDCAPNEGGQRYTACAIISCDGETQLQVDLANTWFRYLLLVFKGNSNARNHEASDYATPTLEETQSSLNSIPASRLGTFRKYILQRDGYQCVLTDRYDRGSMRDDFQGGLQVKLEAVHILKRAVACFDERQNLSAYSTWDIIRNYANWPNETLEHMMELIDTPGNGFMLEHNYHDTFEDFCWTLVPEKTPSGHVLPHTYRVKVLRRNLMPGNDFKEVITFKNCEPPEGLEKVPVAKVYPLPNPEFLALHAAIAQVLYMNGAGQVIDLYMDRSSQDGPAVPSDKIRHGDELAVLLSHVAL